MFVVTRLTNTFLVSIQTVKFRRVVDKNFIDDVGSDLAIVFELGQSEQLAGVIRMTVIRTDHETIFTGVFQHIRQIVVSLTGDEQLMAAAQHVRTRLLSCQLGKTQIEIVHQIRHPLRCDFDSADAELGKFFRMPLRIIE